MSGHRCEMALVIVHLIDGYALVERCLHCRGYQHLFPGWLKRYLKR